MSYGDSCLLYALALGVELEDVSCMLHCSAGTTYPGSLLHSELTTSRILYDLGLEPAAQHVSACTVWVYSSIITQIIGSQGCHGYDEGGLLRGSVTTTLIFCLFHREVAAP